MRYPSLEKMERYVKLGIDLGRVGFRQEDDDYLQTTMKKSGPAQKIRQIAYDNNFLPLKIRHGGKQQFNPELIVIGEQAECFDAQVAGIVRDIVSEGGVELIGLDGGDGRYEKGSGRVVGDRFRFRYARRIQRDDVPFEGEVRSSHYLRTVGELHPKVIFNLSCPVIDLVRNRLDKTKISGQQNADYVRQDLEGLESVDLQVLSIEDMLAWYWLNLDDSKQAVFLAPKKLQDRERTPRLIETKNSRIKLQIFSYYTPGEYRELRLDNLYNRLLILPENQMEQVMAVDGKEQGIIDIWQARGVANIPQLSSALLDQVSQHPVIATQYLSVVKRFADHMEGKKLPEARNFLEKLSVFLSDGNSEQKARLLENVDAEKAEKIIYTNKIRKEK